MANATGPDPRGAQAIAVSTAFTVLAGIFVALRGIARFGMVRNCGIEDVFIIIAFISCVALTALIAVQEQNGMGRHIDTLAPGEFSRMLKPFWASVIVYNTGLSFTKLSILLQYQRFFVATSRRVCWILISIVALYGLWTCIGSIISCLPVAYFWDKTIKGGHCMDLLAFWFSNASFNIVTDISCVILPIPVLKALRLPKKQKYSLIIVFGLGGFGCITSILRLHSLYIVSKSKDITWDNVGAATWSSVELNVGIICACLPTLRPILNKFFPRLLLSTNRNTVELPRSFVMQHSVSSPRDPEARMTFQQTASRGQATHYQSHGSTSSDDDTVPVKSHSRAWSHDESRYDHKRSSVTTSDITGGEKDLHWEQQDQRGPQQYLPQVSSHRPLHSNPVSR